MKCQVDEVTAKSSYELNLRLQVLESIYPTELTSWYLPDIWLIDIHPPELTCILKKCQTGR